MTKEEKNARRMARHHADAEAINAKRRVARAQRMKDPQYAQANTAKHNKVPDSMLSISYQAQG
jgi:hypothetical protein